MMKLAPIVLFVYNRVQHARKTLNAVQKNYLASESDLFIFSDGPRGDGDQKAVNNIRNLIKEINGFNSVTIIERNNNLGLARSIISGVSEIIEKYGRAIVIEDDIVTSPGFLTFINDALNKYEDKKHIFSITGINFIKIPESYKQNTYLFYRCSSWGWATWEDRWSCVDWTVSDYRDFEADKEAQKKFNRGGRDLSLMLRDQMTGEIDSWAIRWAYSHYKNDAYCLYPAVSLVSNIGFDNSGENCIFSFSKYKTNTEKSCSVDLPEKIHLDASIVRRFQWYIWKKFSPQLFLEKILGTKGRHWLKRFFKRNRNFRE